MSHLNNKRILVTGACGTVGSELVKQLMEFHDPEEVIGIDNNESALFFIEQQYKLSVRSRFEIIDICDAEELDRIMQGIDVVFHAAALKHVVLSERSPSQTIRTNIVGLQNIINAALRNSVEKVIFTSSDKAVNPTNVMGTSKLMGERLITAANSNSLNSKTVFASTRFGNVLGSNGSVVPIFTNQIANGGPLTLTHKEMTRFVMSIEQSVGLVIESAALVCGGEVFITKMPVIRIDDLAKVMIRILAPSYKLAPEDIKITTIGSKPGEKLYEELMSEEETRRSIELKKYFAILPAFRGIYRDIDYIYPDAVKEGIDKVYNSSTEQVMSEDQIEKFLLDENILNISRDPWLERYWPGDKEEKKR